MEQRRIYNRPISDSNYFILNQNEGSTEWVSYHLIPSRAKVELEFNIPLNNDDNHFIPAKIKTEFDYSVDEKSVTEKITDWLTLLKGRYTNKILQIEIVCNNNKATNKKSAVALQQILHETNLLLLKHLDSFQHDEVLEKSYHGIAKILTHISEDFVKNGLPKLEESL